MNYAEENSVVYIISSTISWEKHEKLRDINLYADDIVPAILQKIGISKSGESKSTKPNKESDSIHLQANEDKTLSLQTKEFLCRYCRKDDFSSNLELQTHMRTHTGEEPYNCIESFTTKSSSENHEKFVPAEPQICKVCGKEFKKSSNLRRHMSIHTTGKHPFKCDKRFTRKYYLKTNSKIHTNEHLFKCAVCSKQFKKSWNLKTHMRIHTGETPFKCEVCGKQFKQQGYLKTHMRVHTGKMISKCELCSKEFTQHCYLKQHMLVHTNEKPFKCGVCSKQFKKSCNLKRHVSIHTDDTPYKCEVCGNQFKLPGYLKMHMRVHTSVIPYKCEVCGKQFKHSCNLRRHKKVHKDG